MNTTHPVNMHIEIDHRRVWRYRLYESIISLTATHLYSFILLSVFALYTSPKVVYALLITYCFIEALTILCICCYMYFWVGKNPLIDVSTEGCYLHIKTGRWVRRDRKIHFRALQDYTVRELPIERLFGIKTLVISNSNGSKQSDITIEGIKDCELVRDMLCQIDREHESLDPQWHLLHKQLKRIEYHKTYDILVCRAFLKTN